MTSIQFVVAVAFSLVFVAGLLDVAVVQYATGAVRSSLEAGVRAGSRVGADETECRAVAEAWLADVLGGTKGQGIAISCVLAPGEVWATAVASWDAWLPGVPPWQLNLTASRPREQTP